MDVVYPSSSVNQRQRMFRKIMNHKDVFYRHQSKSEPDLSDVEKLEILEEQFLKKPAQFLLRYDEFLTNDDVSCFEQFETTRTDADVQYLLKKLQTKTPDAESRKRQLYARNRRYVQLKRLLDSNVSEQEATISGQYFTDKEMRKRQPLLYDRLIGRFQSDVEMTNILHSADASSTEQQKFSTVLLDMYDNQQTLIRKREQLALEKLDHCNLKENGSADEVEEEEQQQQIEEMDSDDDPVESNNADIKNDKDLFISKSESSKDLKDVSRKIFFTEMMDNFMDGEDDEFFDYGDTKEDEILDKELLKMQDRDLEEQYFASE